MAILVATLVGVLLLIGMCFWLGWKKPAPSAAMDRGRKRSTKQYAMAASSPGVSQGADLGLDNVDGALLWFAMGQGRTPPACPEELSLVLSKAIKRVHRGVLSGEALPRRPHLLPQLMTTLNAPGSNATALAAIIAQDPALAASLIRIANSVVYRRRSQPLESLERVVVTVGNEGLERLLASALVQPVLELNDPDQRKLAAVLWRHGQLASTSSADHARLVEGVDPLPLHLAALLPALATLMMVRGLPRLSNIPLDSMEQWQLVLSCQFQLAAEIARRWELSAEVVDGLQNPHGPIAHSLAFGRRFAWAWMLVEQGQWDAEQAREALAQQAPRHVVDWVWQRQQIHLNH